MTILRFFQAGGGGGGGGIDTVEDEGTSVGVGFTTLNIVGPGITASNAGAGVADVTVSSATPVSVAQANAEGVADTLARSDHVHDHGDQPLGDGLDHAVATQLVAGFMSAADKTKLDGLGGSGSAVLLFGADRVGGTTTTRYLFPGYADSLAQTSSHSLEAPRAGTLQNFYVRQNAPAGNGNSIVYTVRVNGVPTLLSATLASTGTSASDTVDAVAVVAGDAVDVEVTKAAGIGASPQDIVVTLEML